MTEQRKDIIKTLLRHPNSHFTAEELHEKVREINCNIGLATVYRNLDLLEKLDIVKKLNFMEDEAHYEFVEIGEHHHHMICIDCGKIIEFNFGNLQDFKEGLEERYNFHTRKHYIKFFGRCRECQEKNNKVCFG